jgi:hypothetical protein
VQGPAASRDLAARARGDGAAGLPLLELEASFVICHPPRAARLRSEARRLTIDLEQLKVQQMAREVIG